MSNVITFPTGNPHDARNALQLASIFNQVHGYRPGWQDVATNTGRHIDYGIYEDELILWSADLDIKKKVYEPRVMGAAIRTMQRAAYTQLIEDTASLLLSPPKTPTTFADLAIALDLNVVEALCLVSWMVDRKRVLVALAEGKAPGVVQIPMPVFYSRKQGVGKSFLVSQICEPFGALAESKSVLEIEDQFNFLQWGKLLIANFDEMAGLDKTNMNNLKQWTYQVKFTKRKMQSELQNHIYRTVSGIGSSNDPIEDIIWDTTGTRRFCQINVPADGSYIEVARTMDFLSIWQSLDPTARLTPEEAALIAEDQELHRRKDKVELWFEDCGRELLISCTKGIAGAELYAKFRGWCHTSGETTVTSTKFGRLILSRYGEEIDKRKTGGVMMYHRI